MLIDRLSVKNFRSFADFDVSLRDFNVLLGPNAAGKSNFLASLRFLRTVEKEGLVDAVAMYGGAPFLQNAALGSSQSTSFHVETGEIPIHRFQRALDKDTFVGVRSFRAKYRLSFTISPHDNRPTLVEDRCELVLTWVRVPMKDTKREEVLGQSRIVREHHERKITTTQDAPSSTEIPPLKSLDDSLPELDESEALIETPFFGPPILVGVGVFEDIAMYDFDPRLAKRASAFSGSRSLDEHGANLAAVLQQILRDQEQASRFVALAGDLLPFVQKMDVDRLVDSTIVLQMAESYHPERFLPAPLLSDGTINSIAIILALFFERPSFAIFEEPERNLHPALISRLISMMRDGSTNRQTLLSTHNPQVLRSCTLSDLLLVSRDTAGFSRIRRVEKTAALSAFLENDIGLDELFVQNLLAD